MANRHTTTTIASAPQTRDRFGFYAEIQIIVGTECRIEPDNHNIIRIRISGIRIIEEG